MLPAIVSSRDTDGWRRLAALDSDLDHGNGKMACECLVVRLLTIFSSATFLPEIKIGPQPQCRGYQYKVAESLVRTILSRADAAASRAHPVAPPPSCSRYHFLMPCRSKKGRTLSEHSGNRFHGTVHSDLLAAPSNGNSFTVPGKVVDDRTAMSMI